MSSVPHGDSATKSEPYATAWLFVRVGAFEDLEDAFPVFLRDTLTAIFKADYLMSLGLLGGDAQVGSFPIFVVIERVGYEMKEALEKLGFVS